MSMNHINDDINKANSHTKDENISKIILIGSSVIVVKNMANAGEKATKVHPTNSAKVILSLITFFCNKMS